MTLTLCNRSSLHMRTRRERTSLRPLTSGKIPANRRCLMRRLPQGLRRGSATYSSYLDIFCAASRLFGLLYLSLQARHFYQPVVNFQIIVPESLCMLSVSGPPGQGGVVQEEEEDGRETARTRKGGLLHFATISVFVLFLACCAFGLLDFPSSGGCCCCFLDWWHTLSTFPKIIPSWSRPSPSSSQQE